MPRTRRAGALMSRTMEGRTCTWANSRRGRAAELVLSHPPRESLDVEAGSLRGGRARCRAARMPISFISAVRSGIRGVPGGHDADFRCTMQFRSLHQTNPVQEIPRLRYTILLLALVICLRSPRRVPTVGAAIVPFRPRGNDILARAVGLGLRSARIDPRNRGGAGGMMAATRCLPPIPTAYPVSLELAPRSHPALRANNPYFPPARFRGGVALATSAFLLAVHPASPHGQCPTGRAARAKPGR